MEDETKTDMYTCLNIRFSNSRKTYSYISDDPTIETGDFVVVPSKWCDTVVEVVNVGSYEEDELPLPVNKMKKIRSVYRKRADIHYEQPQLPEQNGSLESAHISIDELLELLDGSEYEKQDCLSEEAIRRYEEKNAICLPEEYRLFIKEIGNGIRIPEPNPTLRYQNGRLQYREIYEINPKKVQAFYKYAFPFDSNGYKGELYPNCGYNTGVNIDDICLACDKRFVCPDGDEDLTGNARFHGSMVITYAGCSYAYHLILNGPYRGQVWASGDDWFVPHKKSFSEYLQWLITADYY